MVAMVNELLPGRDTVSHDMFPDALELVQGGVVQVRVGVQADRFALIFKISSSQPIEKDDSANSFWAIEPLKTKAWVVRA